MWSKTLYWKGLEFYRQSSARHGPHKIGILAGSFNPPTIAHIELAQAASAAVDLVVCVIPRAFPHKGYSGATLEQRVEIQAMTLLGRIEPAKVLIELTDQ